MCAGGLLYKQGHYGDLNFEPALRELFPEESQARCFGVSEVTSALILSEQRIIKYICGIQCAVLTEVDFVGCLY